ncbi:hypothetical protein WMF12_46125 [Sorangium sp. So ce363]
MPPRHAQIGPKFVNKNQFLWIESSELLREGLASRCHIFRVALGCVERFFFRVMFSRRNARPTVWRLATM